MDLKNLSDHKAEAAVIATLLYHPEYLAHSLNLKADHFFEMENKLFYWAVTKLFREERVTKIGALELEMVFDSNGSCKRELQKYNIQSIQKYIDNCNYIKCDDIESYKMFVKRILDLSISRDIVKNCEQTVSYIERGKDLTIETLGQKVYKDIQKITTSYTTQDEVQSIGTVGAKIWEEIEKRKAAGEANGFRSFLPSLKDYFIYQKQELVLVSARMKVGKSVFGMLEALNAAQHGVPTLVYDSEMSDKLYFLRILSHYTGIPAMRIENEQLTGDELDVIKKAQEQINKLPLWHIFSPTMSLDQLYTVCYQHKVSHNLQFVIYDYIKGGDETEAAKRSNIMGSMTDYLKNRIGGELELAVLAFAQVGRSGEVAESDAIERYCSVSCALARKTPEQIVDDGADCGEMSILVKLNRLGPSMMPNEYLDLAWGKGLTLQEAKRHDFNGAV